MLSQYKYRLISWTGSDLFGTSESHGVYKRYSDAEAEKKLLEEKYPNCEFEIKEIKEEV